MFAGQATINVEIVEVGRSGVAEYADINKPLNALEGNLARLRASSLLLIIQSTQRVKRTLGTRPTHG